MRLLWFEKGKKLPGKASAPDPDLVFTILLREARSEVSKKFENPFVRHTVHLRDFRCGLREVGSSLLTLC